MQKAYVVLPTPDDPEGKMPWFTAVAYDPPNELVLYWVLYKDELKPRQLQAKQIDAARVNVWRLAKPTGGRKDDSNKPRWSLLPTGTVGQIVEVLEIGAVKYDIDNWQRVPDARRRYYDALQRHVEAWWNGQRDDPETGKHHLAHAGCCILFLLWGDK